MIHKTANTITPTIKHETTRRVFFNISCRKIIRTAVLSSAVMIICAVPVSAASPRFARTEEEWAELENNILRYEELPALIHEYNPTVLNNQYSYDSYIKKYGHSSDEAAWIYRDAADDLEGRITGEDGMSVVSDYNLQVQADSLREQADLNVNDSTTESLNYQKAEAELVKQAQNKYISYFKAELSLKSAAERVKQAQTNLALTQAKVSAGMALPSALLTAQENLSARQNELRQLELDREKTREELIIMCGWKSSDLPEIMPVPVPELPDPAEIDTAAALKKAMDSNYTLAVNRRRLSNALYKDNLDEIGTQVKDNENKIEFSYNSALQSYILAKSAYDQAAASLSLSESAMLITEQKKAAGMISSFDYENEVSTLGLSRLSCMSSLYDLYTAYNNYEWCVNGLASAQ